MRSLLLLATLFAYEPPGTEPIQIRFDQKDLSPQQVPIKIDLQGVTLKEDVKLDIHLAKAKGEEWVKDLTYKNCDGMKVGQKGVISILCKPAQNNPARERRVDIEVTFGAAAPDKPQLSIATFGYYTTLTPGKKPQAKRVRMNLRSFGNDYHAKVMKEYGRQQEFNMHWEDHLAKDNERYSALSESMKSRDNLSGSEKTALLIAASKSIAAKYKGMPKTGQLEEQEIFSHVQWCKEYEGTMYIVQNVPRLHYEAYTIGSTGKTVVGRTR